MDGLPRLDVGQWWDSLSGEQRFSLVVFGVCGGLALILSIAYLTSSLSSPFRVSKSTLLASQQTFKRIEEQNLAQEASKTKDTDRDGLSDYSELYVYRTSPYLADTDSDGIPDAIEIAQATDPNCPAGTNCVSLSTVDAALSSNTSTLSILLGGGQVENAALILGSNDPGVQGAQRFVANPPDPSTMTPAGIRDYFVSNGLVQAGSLDGLSDQQVIQLYQAAYNQAIQIRQVQQTGSLSTSTTP